MDKEEEKQTESAAADMTVDAAGDINRIVAGLQDYQSGLNRLSDYLARVDKYVAGLNTNLKSSGLLLALANFDQAKEAAEHEQKILAQLAAIQRWQQQAKAADDKALRELRAERKLDQIRKALQQEDTQTEDMEARRRSMDEVLAKIARIVDGHRGRYDEAEAASHEQAAPDKEDKKTDKDKKADKKSEQDNPEDAPRD